MNFCLPRFDHWRFWLKAAFAAALVFCAGYAFLQPPPRERPGLPVDARCDGMEPGACLDLDGGWRCCKWSTGDITYLETREPPGPPGVPGYEADGPHPGKTFTGETFDVPLARFAWGDPHYAFVTNTGTAFEVEVWPATDAGCLGDESNYICFPAEAYRVTILDPDLVMVLLPDGGGCR